MTVHAKNKPTILGELLGLPAIIALAVLLWWQWKLVHIVSLQFFMWLDRSLTLSSLPPLAVYALTGTVLTMATTLLKQDRLIIGGVLSWRALLLPLLWGVLLWQL